MSNTKKNLLMAGAAVGVAVGAFILYKLLSKSESGQVEDPSVK